MISTLILNTSEMLICRATQEDSEQIWSIFQEVISTGDKYPFPPETSKEFCDSYFLNPQAISFVIKHDQRVFGCYKVVPNQCGLASHVANATYMVAPGLQGKGIGAILVKHSLQEALKAGYEAMQFNFVVSTNTAAIHLYKKLGFTIIGTVPNAFNNLKLQKKVDVYIMHRMLDKGLMFE
jgi:L-amino acid N-acyltransferase YncA